MLFASNQEKNESNTFKYMLLQPENSYFILSMVKDVQSHEARNNWTLIIKSEVNNKHKNRYGRLKNILSIWYFKRKIFPEGKLMKQKSRICAHGLIQQWVVNYWETYSSVVNWFIVKFLLAIASIHKFPSRSIDFVGAFLHSNLAVDVFMNLTLVVGVDGNRV